MSSYEYIVEMKNITKRFPNIIANDNIDLKIKKGEIFALLGENGAGKSTIMSILFGMYEPEEGEIFIKGNKVRIQSPNQATELSIGMVHQHFKLISNYTIGENIILGIEPENKKFGLFPFVSLKESNKKIIELSKKYGLEVDPTEIIENINVSTQQRVEILKMLYREAEILIFDEPTAVLTPQEIEYFLGILNSLKEDGKTIILITHKLEEIKKVADRCVVMRRGKMVGEPLDVKTTSTQEMAHLMVGRDVEFNLGKIEHEFGDIVVNVENLIVKEADNVEVVKNISFSVRKGEIFAIAGVSGNGQIELIDAIAGLRKVSSGKITLNGDDITHLKIRDRVEKGISFIPEDRQRYGLILDFSLEDDISLRDYYKKDFCRKGILVREKFTSYANELIEKYDIRSAEGVNTITRSMSGGNQQKVIIAREIELGSDLMLFVQPTRGLDIGAIENIQKKIIEQRNNNKAVILVSLELDEVMNCADTIGVIYSGELIEIKSRNQLDTKQVGEYMMGVKK